MFCVKSKKKQVRKNFNFLAAFPSFAPINCVFQIFYFILYLKEGIGLYLLFFKSVYYVCIMQGLFIY